jgi:hypothetical protein
VIRRSHRWRTVVLVLGVLIAARLLQSIAATRSPRRSLGDGPITGSLDTWPAVPRNAAAAPH